MNDISIGNELTMRTAFGASLGKIDQYELVRELGGGGFGTVLLARDTVAGIDIAVKGLPPLVKNNREELENIRKNFALVSRLHHPHIAAALVLHPVKRAVYSDKTVAEKLRVFEGDFLVVMEYAPGVTLSQWRKQFPNERVPVARALEIISEIASALDYAHTEKIIHRDVKPANVMIETRTDGSLTARVLDFGLAAEVRSSLGRVSQQVTDTSGTRPYMAPEQWLGRRQNAATDQYALAALAYELLTGEVPFSSVFETGDPVVMMNVVGRETPDIAQELPRAMRKAFVRAFAKDPAQRFGNCAEFIAALNGSHVVNLAESGESMTSFRIFAMWTVIVLIAVLVAGGYFWHSYNVRQNALLRQMEENRRAETMAAEATRVEMENKTAAELEAKCQNALKEQEAKVERDATKCRDEEAKRRNEEAIRRDEEAKRRKAELESAKKAQAEKRQREANAAAEAERQREISRKKEEEVRRRAALKRYSEAKEHLLESRQQALAVQADQYADEMFKAAEEGYKAMKDSALREDYVEAESNAAHLAEAYAKAKTYADEHPLAWYARGRAAERNGDGAEAVRCYRKAADGRVPEAAISLGLLYLNGRINGQKDETAAAKNFRAAALLGHAHGQYLYAGCLAQGRGVAFDKEAARTWMALAEISGDAKARDFNLRAKWTVSESDVGDVIAILKGERDQSLKDVSRNGMLNCAREVRRSILLATVFAPQVQSQKNAPNGSHANRVTPDAEITQRLVGHWICRTQCRSMTTINTSVSVTDTTYDAEYFSDGRLKVIVVTDNSQLGRRETKTEGTWFIRSGRLYERWLTDDTSMISDLIWNGKDEYVYRNDCQEYQRLLNALSAKTDTDAKSNWTASYDSDGNLLSINEMSQNGRSWTLRISETPRIYHRH